MFGGELRDPNDALESGEKVSEEEWYPLDDPRPESIKS